MNTQASIDIQRPVDVVFAYLIDPRHRAEWLSGTAEVEELTPGPIAIGKRWRFNARPRGKQVTIETEVVAFEPGRRLTERIVKGPLSGEISATFESVGSATRVTAQAVDVKLNGALRLFQRMVATRLEQRLSNGLRDVKRTLEKA